MSQSRDIKSYKVRMWHLQKDYRYEWNKIQTSIYLTDAIKEIRKKKLNAQYKKNVKKLKEELQEYKKAYAKRYAKEESFE